MSKILIEIDWTVADKWIIKHTRAKPFFECPEIIVEARSAHKPAAILAARAECSFAYVSGVK